METFMRWSTCFTMILISVAAMSLGVAWAITAVQLNDYGFPAFGAAAWGLFGIGYLILTIGYFRHLLGDTP
jgi:hypothetical protein